MTLTIELISGAATIIAIAGVVLNNHRRRDAVFLALAIHGLAMWRRK